MSYFAVRRHTCASCSDPLPMHRPPLWTEHAPFMNGLAARGFIVLGGPVGHNNESLHIVQSDSASTILATLAEDPWEPAGLLRTVSVEPWNIVLGDPAALGRGGRAG